MFEWLSDNRASIASVLIILIAVAFVTSIFFGRRASQKVAKEAVFGDPEGTRGGWYWAVCGVTSLLLIWFYYSWGTARAYYPEAANELCQIAKVEEALSPIKAALPLGSRYYKSTLLVRRNMAQLDRLDDTLPSGAFTSGETAELRDLLAKVRQLIINSSDPSLVQAETRPRLDDLVGQINALSAALRAGPSGAQPTAEALAQPKWGVTDIEIPLLPITQRGVLFDETAEQAQALVAVFNRARNQIPANDALIAQIKPRIAALKAATEAGSFSQDDAAARVRYVKSLERIFRRLDDGRIFPAATLDGVNTAIADLEAASN
ncbi:MAG: ABC transporter permease, partial [Pseudomonadota bacterium]